MYLLIVDDDPLLVRILTRVGTTRGFDVGASRTAESALTEVSARRPDAILLDIGLDGALDGRDVLSRLQASGIAVFVHTGRNDEFTKALCEEYGAADYLVKPMNPTVIFERMERYLAKRATAPG